MGADQVAVENQLLNLRHVRGTALCGRGVWTTRPVRLLVDLDAFFVRLAEDHRAESPVTQGQRVVPLAGRLGAPDHGRRIPRGSRERRALPWRVARGYECQTGACDADRNW